MNLPFLDVVCAMDVRDFCYRLPPGSVNVIVTSPPYFRQRIYEGVSPVIWGSNGFGSCTHEWQEIEVYDSNLSGGRNPANSSTQLNNHGSYQTDTKQRILKSAYCSHCNAWYGTLGNEPTVAQYVANIVEIAHALWYVLRDDGIFWLNIDGKYNGSGGAGGDYAVGGIREGQKKFPRTVTPNYKTKDWIPIPWLVGIALQQAGWYLRTDCIWHKPNGFVSSAKDRPTRNHEYVLQLTKSPRYYYDYEGVAEPAKYAGDKRSQRGDARRGKAGMNSMNSDTKNTRNRRSVITLPTKPSAVPHYATFNTDLIKPLIVAGCPAGGVVFDPFMGVGTTALAAKELGRHFVGCDASPEYVAIALDRIGKYIKCFDPGDE